MASLDTSKTNTSPTIITDKLTDIQSDGQDELKQLERNIIEKEASLDKTFVDFANSIVHLNVGGKKISTSRKILTLIEGTLLSTVFSGRWNEKLVKDADGAYFFDYDPVLFKHLINQLRYWSLNPLVTRVFSSPSGNQNEFISFVRCLKFAERFLSDTFSEKENSNVKIVDNQRLCVKIGEDQHCAYVTGTLLYFQGKHFIKLVTSLTKQIGFIGIRPANIPIQVKSTKTYLPISDTFGIDNNCLVIDGHCITMGTSWVTGCLSNTFVIELDCDARTMHIKRDQYYSQIDHGFVRFIDLTSAQLPWQLFIVLKNKHDYVRLLL